MGRKKKHIELKEVFELKEAFEESDLPFRVDFFVWDEVPEKFHKNIRSEYFLLQKRLNRNRLSVKVGFRINDA